MCKNIETNKLINKKYIYPILTCLWICFIFSFSLQPGEKSDIVSNTVGDIIIKNSSIEASEKFEMMSYEELKIFHLIIRKCGHFGEFFILGILMTITWNKRQVVHRKHIVFALCAAVAATDETIQLFVSERSGQVTDVLLDCFGSLCGICVYMIVVKLLERRKWKGV